MVGVDTIYASIPQGFEALRKRNKSVRERGDTESETNNVPVLSLLLLLPVLSLLLLLQG